MKLCQWPYSRWKLSSPPSVLFLLLFAHVSVVLYDKTSKINLHMKKISWMSFTDLWDRQDQKGSTSAGLNDDSQELWINGAEGTVPRHLGDTDVVVALLSLDRLAEDMAKLTLPHDATTHSWGERRKVGVCKDGENKTVIGNFRQEKKCTDTALKIHTWQHCVNNQAHLKDPNTKHFTYSWRTLAQKCQTFLKSIKGPSLCPACFSTALFQPLNVTLQFAVLLYCVGWCFLWLYFRQHHQERETEIQVSNHWLNQTRNEQS